jgi:hypothetical protein
VAVNYQFVKRYENLAGVDYKSSDLKFPEQYATALRNIQFTNTGSIEKRKGYQGSVESQGGRGLFTYKRYNTSTGAETVEMVAVGSNAFKLKEGTLTVTYSGSALVCTASIIYDTATSDYRFKLVEGTTEVLNYDLGVGIDELAPVDVTTLAAAIGATVGFTAIATVGTMPAAFLDTTVEHDLLASGLVLKLRYWDQINAPQTPFPGNVTYANSADFENTSGVQLYNILYLSNGYDSVKKYDGQNIYNAGVPATSVSLANSTVAGVLGTDNYSYKVTVLQKDAQGNEVEGNPVTSATVDYNGNQIDVTVNNILAASGYNTNCAVVDGAQAAVNTIVVDNGSGGVHTMKVGDTAYFYDAVSGGYVERTVTAVDVTAPTYSITVSGAAVTVADNAVISNNLRIAVYRSKNSTGTPTVWYSLVELPNNSFTSTQTYRDNIADASLGAVYLEPATDRSPPPKGRYVSTFQGLLVTAGNLDEVNTVSFSDVENPEYFPVPDNQIIVNDIIGDRVTGIAPSNEFFIIFQSQGIHVLSGDFVGGSFKVDQVANDIGCAAHASIQDVRGALMFMSLQGPRLLQGGQVPRGLGPFEQNPFVSRIDPVFDQAGISNTALIFQLKRSVSFHDRTNQKYILFIPCETTTSGTVAANEYSVTFVYDYPRDAWLEWDMQNMAGGIVEYSGNVFFSERRYSSALSALKNFLYKVHNTNTRYDYANNTAAISCYWKSAWDFLGEASILKSFLAVTVFSTGIVENDFTLTFRSEVNWLPDTKSEVSISIGTGGYGVDRWDLDPWGSPVEPTYPRKLNNNRVKSIRAVLVNEEMQKNIGVTGYEFEIAAPYKPRFVK